MLILLIILIGCHNKETNKKTYENVIVMENIFYEVSYYYNYYYDDHDDNSDNEDI